MHFFLYDCKICYKSYSEYVTFSSSAYYISRKSSKFAGDYDFGRENNKRDTG